MGKTRRLITPPACSFRYCLWQAVHYTIYHWEKCSPAALWIQITTTGRMDCCVCHTRCHSDYDRAHTVRHDLRTMPVGAHDTNNGYGSTSQREVMTNQFFAKPARQYQNVRIVVGTKKAGRRWGNCYQGIRLLFLYAIFLTQQHRKRDV